MSKVASTPSVAPTRRAESGYVGSLFVESDPPSAVFINQAYVGETPIALSDLHAGSHVVWLQRDGYDRWSGAISVSAGHTTRLGPKLQPTPVR